jgi:thiosulfate/3-mercaptopyruvate sulfurtransferase
MIVTTSWLAGRLSDPNLVILAVGPKDDYAKEHIPGALSLPMNEVATPMVMGQLMLELPPMDQLAKTFTGLGITNSSRIVLYISNPGLLAAMTRVYLTFDATGLGARTAILDGGLAAWKSEQRPVTAEVRAVKPGTLDLCAQKDVITGAEWVRANAGHSGTAIVDARVERFYTGEAAGSNHDGSAQRKGHIPGASNIPFNTFTDAAGKFLPAAEWKKKYEAAGIKPGDRVVSYCHIGQQATVIYFAARYLGYDARLYDGSWEDWSAHESYPAETK